MIMDDLTKAVASAGVGASMLMASNIALAVEPANMRAGPVYFTPTLEVETRYVDNILRSSDDELNSWVAQLNPQLQAWMQNGNNTYSLSFQLDDSTYTDSSDDNFTDKRANLDIFHEFNSRNMMNVFGEFYDGHEERGTGLSEGVIASRIDEPVEYERSIFGGDYTYGNRESSGRLKFAAKTVTYDYQNFRAFTQFRDRTQDTVSGTFFWKTGTKTDVFLELRAIDNKYDTVDELDFRGSLDSTELNYQLGVTWDATARTSGTVKLGRYDREYDSASRQDDDGFHWEVDVVWNPRTYSAVNFGTRRYSRETNGAGDFINTDEYTVEWEHQWNSRSSTFLAILVAEDDYSGALRADDRSEVEFSYSFAARRWVDLGAGYRWEKRDSDLPSLDYTRNVFFLQAEFSL